MPGRKLEGRVRRNGIGLSEAIDTYEVLWLLMRGGVVLWRLTWLDLFKVSIPIQSATSRWYLFWVVCSAVLQPVAHPSYLYLLLLLFRSEHLKTRQSSRKALARSLVGFQRYLLAAGHHCTSNKVLRSSSLEGGKPSQRPSCVLDCGSAGSRSPSRSQQLGHSTPGVLCCRRLSRLCRSSWCWFGVDVWLRTGSRTPGTSFPRPLVSLHRH